MDSRDIFLVAVLLSAGTFLRFVLVMAGEPVTPNVMVAFYSVIIMIFVRSFGGAIGVGLVSGIITALISQSLINPAFLLSEPLGAAVCLMTFISLRYHKRIASFAAAFAATVASGIVYTALALSISSARILGTFPDPTDFLFRMALIIIVTALINACMATLLYHTIRTYQGRNLS
ncbi:MAG: hypothetical protein LUQ37_01340 [Methanoregulaceae archaeon]|jgi:hypothetical protein|nr:hypothetical protein [Methanoregulaceae archaeon]